MPDPTSASRILIAGGGVAALEAILALRELVGDRAEITMLSPEADFVYRPMAVAEPFSRGRATRHPLRQIADQLGVDFRQDAVTAIDPAGRRVTTAAGRDHSYHALLVAVGARSEPAFRRPLTWTPERDPELFAGLLRDLEEGYLKKVAFVVPPGVAWPLPAYELALMTAWEAWGMGQDDAQITIYTPEEAPLGLFGAAASAGVRHDLAEAGVEVVTGAYVSELEGSRGDLVVHPGETPLDAERVVALPRAVGPELEGLPADFHGFVLTDRHGKVPDTEGIWAAGDAIAFPVKQGGLAAQEADAAAEAMAAFLGADVEPRPFRPVLRGMMLTGRGKQWTRHAAAGGQGEGTTSHNALWWPPTKVAGRYLSPFLAVLDGGEAIADAQAPDGKPVELDLERDLPAAADALRQATLRSDEHRLTFERMRAEARRKPA